MTSSLHRLTVRVCLNAIVLGMLLVLPGQTVHGSVSARDGTSLRATRSVGTPVFAEGSKWSWRKLYSPFEAMLANRTRMIQFASLAMCVALYIIWWRR